MKTDARKPQETATGDAYLRFDRQPLSAGRGSLYTFLNEYRRAPRVVGSVVPSSRFLSKRMATATDAAIAQYLENSPDDCPPSIIELGAGSGAITAGIKHHNPLLVELSQTFCECLHARFPDLVVRQGCAIDSLKQLTAPTGVVISIPLLSTPIANAIKAELKRQRKKGNIAFCVIYTYGARAPLEGLGFYNASRSCCLLNLPPAFVWTYR